MQEDPPTVICRGPTVLCLVAYAAVALEVFPASLEAATVVTIRSLSTEHSCINANNVLLVVPLKYFVHLEHSSKVEMDHGEKPARFYLGFYCCMLSLAIALFDGLESNQPRLQGNLLCRRDCLQLRRIARPEWGGSCPSTEVAANPWRTVCEHLRSGDRPEARRALSAHAGWVPWCRWADKADGPCSGHMDSICDSEREHWEWDLDVAGGCCPSVPEPPFPLQLTVQFKPRFLLQRAHSRSLSVSASMVLWYLHRPAWMEVPHGWVSVNTHSAPVPLRGEAVGSSPHRDHRAPQVPQAVSPTHSTTLTSRAIVQFFAKMV